MKVQNKVIVVTGGGNGMGIEADRYSVLVGPDARFMDFIYRLNPKNAANFIYKQMKALLPA